MATVLIVDDDKMVRAFLTDVFSDLGLQTVAAASASEALDLIGQGLAFDLAVTDLIMAGQTGAQLVAELRGRGCSQPIYVLTGSVGAVECPGATGVLRKPIKLDVLEKIVRGAV